MEEALVKEHDLLFIAMSVKFHVFSPIWNKCWLGAKLMDTQILSINLYD